MKASDVMILLDDFLRPTDSVITAISFLLNAKRDETQQGVQVAPVLDDRDRLIGLLTISDVFKATLPAYLSLLDLGAFTWEGMLMSTAKKLQGMTVNDIMTKTLHLTQQHASLMECVDIMNKYHVHHLPIVNEQGKAIGMIYKRDIFERFASAILNNKEENL
jgi:predicted transcriptional regulator